MAKSATFIGRALLRPLANRLLLQRGMQWRISLTDRAFNLASDIMRLTPQMARLGPEQAHISRQLFRAATSIGANLEEGKVAVSRKDMGLKHAIALREARETVFWLRLLQKANVMSVELEPVRRESGEMVAMLTASVKKLREVRSEKA